MKLVPYATWPESQVMLDCKHSQVVQGEMNEMICLKEGGCTCLRNGEVDEEDKIDEEEEEEEYDDPPRKRKGYIPTEDDIEEGFFNREAGYEGG